MRMPLFSIITVCKDASATIDGTIDSMVKQSFKDYEWLVVDGASNDDTVSRVRQSAAPGMKVVTEPDSGIYAAMNKGIRMASGEFIHFLNADDSYADSGVLTDVAASLRGDPSCDLLYGDMLVDYPSGRSELFRPPPPDRAMEEMVCECLPQPAMFARRQLFYDQLGFFDESLKTAADYKWLLGAVSHPGVKLSRLPRLISRFYAGGASSKLEAVIPEGVKVLNEHAAMWKCLGQANGIRSYQRHLEVIQVALLNARARLDAMASSN